MQGSQEGASGEADPDMLQKVLSQAYDIADENIRLGMGFSTSQSHPPPPFDKKKELKELVDRLADAVSDIGLISVDLAKMAIDLIPVSQDGSVAAGLRIPVQIKSFHAVQSHASLSRCPVNGVHLSALRHETGQPVLEDCRLVPGPIIQINVPEDAPSGQYTADILEHDARDPLGTLSVHLVRAPHE